MSPQSPAPCPHELRPGTTVCLHCRYAEHQARAARTRAFLLRAGYPLANAPSLEELEALLPF